MRARVVALLAVSLAACSTSGDQGGDVIVPGQTPGAAAGAGGAARSQAPTTTGTSSSGVQGSGSNPAPAQAQGEAGTGSGATTGDAGSAIPAASSDLPCDLETLLHDRCQACHTRPPAGGAPMALLTYADLIAPAKSDASQRVADRALARMERGEMPPAANPPLSDAEIAVLRDWIAAGAERGTCATATPVPDGGVPDDAAVVMSPYDTPTMCSSGAWNGGEEESPRMHPGGECITCHSRSEGPDFSIGGTVYPSAHEPIDCDGIDGDQLEIDVVITDAEGGETRLHVNEAGNFYASKNIKFPIHAKVVSAGRERAMSAAQMTGNCNHCHTATGANGAPGRIMAP
jgi:mono/diheme cytochrome c family protein